MFNNPNQASESLYGQAPFKWFNLRGLVFIAGYAHVVMSQTFVAEFRELGFVFGEPLPLFLEPRNMVFKGSLTFGDLDFVHLFRNCAV